MAWIGGGWNKGRRMGPQSSGANVSRRDFLRAGGLSMVGWSLAEKAALASWRPAHLARRCIFVLMTGGPSQLETFDPKPDASSQIRGPFRAISTSVPGLQLSETLPLLAQRADRFSLIRTLSHDFAPLHETGLQLLQTGQLARRGQTFPHWSSVVARYGGQSRNQTASHILPQPLDAAASPTSVRPPGSSATTTSHCPPRPPPTKTATSSASTTGSRASASSCCRPARRWSKGPAASRSTCSIA